MSLWLQRDSNSKSLSSWTNTQPLSQTSWVFVYKLSGCGFESCCSHLNFRYRACCEEGVPWHSGNYRERIHSQNLEKSHMKLGPSNMAYLTRSNRWQSKILKQTSVWIFVRTFDGPSYTDFVTDLQICTIN